MGQNQKLPREYSWGGLASEVSAAAGSRASGEEVKTGAKWTWGSLTPSGGVEARRHGTRGGGDPESGEGDRAGARRAGGKCSRGRGWLLEDSPGETERRAEPLVGDKTRGAKASP